MQMNKAEEKEMEKTPVTREAKMKRRKSKESSAFESSRPPSPKRRTRAHVLPPSRKTDEISANEPIKVICQEENLLLKEKEGEETSSNFNRPSSSSSSDPREDADALVSLSREGERETVPQEDLEKLVEERQWRRKLNAFNKAANRVTDEPEESEEVEEDTGEAGETGEAEDSPEDSIEKALKSKFSRKCSSFSPGKDS